MKWRPLIRIVYQEEVIIQFYVWIYQVRICAHVSKDICQNVRIFIGMVAIVISIICNNKCSFFLILFF